jgi:mRNA-degrading endonuclease RelE of RelBE toxin-antitoxin system
LPDRYVLREAAKNEFRQLPPNVREEFLYAIHGLLFQPFRPGPGYRVKELREAPGLWRLRLSTFPAVRAYYDVDGQTLRVYGFGPRPEFYNKLRQKDRLSR